MSVERRERCFCSFDVWEMLKQLADGDFCLKHCQMGTQAKMRARSKTKMAAQIGTGRIEAVWIGESGFVPICGTEHARHCLAFGNGDAGNLNVGQAMA